MSNRSNNKPRRHAFTLMEVMLVLVILVIIGGIAAVAFQTADRNARIKAADAQIKGFSTPLGMYRMDIDDFPASADGLQALRTAPSGLANPAKWRGPYLDKDVPLDPWENPYSYEYPGKHQTDQPDIWSFGPDQLDGTEDDIGNWSVVSSQ